MRVKPAPVIAALAFALAPAARALDLLEAWQAAEQHAAEAAVARAARDAGAAQQRQADALWRPNVALEGGAAYGSAETTVRGARFGAPAFGRSDDVSFDTSVTGGTSTRYALALRQPIYSRERSARGDRLAIAAQAAETGWTQARQALMLRTAEAWFDVALAGERLRLVARQQAAVERTLAETRERFRVGDKPVTDVHEGQARAAALAADRLAAETALELARHALADLTGVDDAAPLPLSGDAPQRGSLPTLEDWLARADAHNAGLELASRRVAAAEAEARATDAPFSPTLDVVARVGRERISGDGDFGNARTSSRDASIGLQLALPLYTGGMRSAQHAEAAARIAGAQAELDAARRRVAHETRAAWLELSVGWERSAALAAALDASRLRLDATRTGLEAGDRTTLDLLNAENDAAAAELALAQARIRLLTDRLRLALLAGELDEAALRQAQAGLVARTPER